jgi:hypothetical protein
MAFNNKYGSGNTLEEQTVDEWYEIPGSRLDLQPTPKSNKVYITIKIRMKKGHITGNIYEIEPMFNLYMFEPNSFNEMNKMEMYLNPSKALLISSVFDMVLNPHNMNRIFNFGESIGYQVKGEYTNKKLYTRKISKDLTLNIIPRVDTRSISIPAFELNLVRESKNNSSSIILSESELKRVRDVMTNFSCNSAMYVMTYTNQVFQNSIDKNINELRKLEYLANNLGQFEINIKQDILEMTEHLLTTLDKRIQTSVGTAVAMINTQPHEHHYNNPNMFDKFADMVLNYDDDETEFLETNEDDIIVPSSLEDVSYTMEIDDEDEKSYTDILVMSSSMNKEEEPDDLPSIMPSVEHDHSNLQQLEISDIEENKEIVTDPLTEIKELEEEPDDALIGDIDPFIKKLNVVTNSMEPSFNILDSNSKRKSELDLMIDKIYNRNFMEYLTEEQVTSDIKPSFIDPELKRNKMKNFDPVKYLEDRHASYGDLGHSCLKIYFDKDILNASTFPGMFVYKSKIGSPVMNVIISSSILAAMFENSDKLKTEGRSESEIDKLEYDFISEIRFGENKLQQHYTKYIDFISSNFLGVEESVSMEHIYMLDKMVLDGTYDYNYFECGLNGLSEKELVYVMKGLGIVYLTMWFANDKYIRLNGQVPENYKLFGVTNDYSISFARAMIINIAIAFKNIVGMAFKEMIKMEELIDNLGWDKTAYYDAISTFVIYYNIIVEMNKENKLNDVDETGYIKDTMIFNGPTCKEYVDKYFKEG